MSLKIKILRESIRSFSYLQDVLTWSNSLDDTTCTDSQSWTSWRCSGYTTHCLSFIVVSKIFLMVKSTQLCGEKQREDVNLVTTDTRQCDCLCSRARAPRAFFFLHQSKHHLASHARGIDCLQVPRKFQVISGICSRSLHDVNCQEDPVIKTCAIGKHNTAKSITGVVISKNTYMQLYSFLLKWDTTLPASWN